MTHLTILHISFFHDIPPTFCPGFLCRLWYYQSLYLSRLLAFLCYLLSSPIFEILLSNVRIQTLQNGGCRSVPPIACYRFSQQCKKAVVAPSANPRPASTSPQPPTLITNATGWVAANSSPPDLPSISMHHPRITTRKFRH